MNAGQETVLGPYLVKKVGDSIQAHFRWKAG